MVRNILIIDIETTHDSIRIGRKCGDARQRYEAQLEIVSYSNNENARKETGGE